MLGFPNAATETAQEFDQQIVNSAENPLFVIQTAGPGSKAHATCGPRVPGSAQEPQLTSIGRRAAATLSEPKGPEIGRIVGMGPPASDDGLSGKGSRKMRPPPEKGGQIA